ncbi:MAG: S-methyl-5-thioribose-1-phosphate isomerase [bacterium]
MRVETIMWKGGLVYILDQKKLPQKKVYIKCSRYQQVADAIIRMNIRGAPAIGVGAAMGIALGMKKLSVSNKTDFFIRLDKIGKDFATTRPTAVNLFWAIDRMAKCARKHEKKSISTIKELLIKEAIAIYHEDIAANRKMGEYGAKLIPKNAHILTHCNAGALATAGYGTALGVIRKAHSQGKNIKVFVDETRPFLQGARLTAWELKEEKIPFTLITDNMSGYFMYQGKINAVIVGADRIAANGDVVNKIGTYTVSVLAKTHGIPFYVAAPVSTFDLTKTSGDEITIEQRKFNEVTHIGNSRITPIGIEVANPAFDVTPHKNVTAIITEKGIIKPPFKKNIAKIIGKK